MPEAFLKDLPNQRPLAQKCHMKQLHPRHRTAGMVLLTFQRPKRIVPSWQFAFSPAAKKQLGMAKSQNSHYFVCLHPQGYGLHSSLTTKIQYWTHHHFQLLWNTAVLKVFPYSLSNLSPQPHSGGASGNTSQKLAVNSSGFVTKRYLLCELQTTIHKINNIVLFSIFISLALNMAIEWEQKTSVYLNSAS